MENYYTILGVDASVSQGELESRWEDEYNKIRRLVTHHNPSVAEEANHKLRMLEQARNILFDPAKRAAYTAGLADQKTSGLGDPSAQSAPGPASAAPRGAYSVPPPPPQQDLNVWTCPDCGERNVVGKRYCSKCGGLLAKNCPNCQNLNQLADVYCSTCGVDIEETVHEQKMAEEKRQQEERVRRERMAEEQERIARREKQRRNRNRLISLIVYGAIIGAIVFGVRWFQHKKDVEDLQRIEAVIYDQTHPNWIGSTIKVEVQRSAYRSVVGNPECNFNLIIKNITEENIEVGFSVADIYAVDNLGNRYENDIDHSDPMVEAEIWRRNESVGVLHHMSVYLDIYSPNGFSDAIQYFTIYMPDIHGERNISIVVPVSVILNWDTR